MGNRDFFQIRAAKQGRYKLNIRRWQPGENLLKYYPTARRAELRGVERLISDNIQHLQVVVPENSLLELLRSMDSVLLCYLS